MEERKIHLCDACGGHLEVDLERQVYRCPFCGVTYDYAYFKEDDVLSMAQTYEERGELDAALDAYKFYLTKDPHDTRSLKRVMLLTYGLTDINKLRRPDVIANLKADPKETEWIVESAPEKDREYFETLQEIFVTAKKYRDLCPRLKSIDEKIKEGDKVVGQINGRIDSCDITLHNDHGETTDYIAPEDAPKKMFFICLGTGGLFAVWTSLEFRSPIPGIIIMILALLFYVGFYFLFIVPARQRKEVFEGQKGEVESKIESIKADRKKITDQMDVLTQKIRKLMLKISKQDQTEGPW